MTLYAGIDLHSTNLHLAVVTDDGYQVSISWEANRST